MRLELCGPRVRLNMHVSGSQVDASMIGRWGRAIKREVKGKGWCVLYGEWRGLGLGEEGGGTKGWEYWGREGTSVGSAFICFVLMAESGRRRGLDSLHR